ncbi:MAG: FAD-binding protein [Hymenobacter sp.]|nr:FAD-binding protein [Hymenobacter sp.]
MEDFPRYEVVIAGAGPAGCAAALMLHRAGRRVCLVDENPTPGPKVGESLPGAASRLLHQLGIAGLGNLLAPADYHACAANASAWGSEQWTYQSALANPEGGGWHLNRAAFDAALHRHAGAAGVPCYAAQVNELSRAATAEWLVQLKHAGDTKAIRTAWLIDATGRRAYVCRRQHLAREQLDTQMAAVSWVPSATHDHDRTTRIKSVPTGWWYTARLPTGRRVICFHGLPAAVAAHLKNPTAFFAAFDATGILPYAASPAEPMEIKGMDASVARLPRAATAGLLAVGDAALAFDPISSQGIFFALYSGIKGAETIIRILAAPHQETLAFENYQAQVNRVFEANQRSRKLFYTSEFRYLSEAYWQTRMGALVMG